jgi:hypothetical protein
MLISSHVLPDLSVFRSLNFNLDQAGDQALFHLKQLSREKMKKFRQKRFFFGGAGHINGIAISINMYYSVKRVFFHIITPFLWGIPL